MKKNTKNIFLVACSLLFVLFLTACGGGGSGGSGGTAGNETTNTIPSTPTAFTVTPASSSQIYLSWTASTGIVTGYKIYKGGTYLKSVAATTTSDAGLLHQRIIATT
jgi:hypothetical protein